MNIELQKTNSIIKDEETHLPLPLPENPDTLASGRIKHQQHGSSTHSSAANQDCKAKDSRGPLSKFLSHSATNKQTEVEQEQRFDQNTNEHFKLPTSFEILKAPSMVSDCVNLSEDEKED